MAIPDTLKPGDKVRLVSPASRPDPDMVSKHADIYRSWGLEVEIAPHAFDKLHYLAGRDEDRLADINDALRDPSVRAVIATRGGKGSYRIAEGIDFEAVWRDPKIVAGFSDITCLQLMLWRQCRLPTVHGALMPDEAGNIAQQTLEAMRAAMMDGYAQCLRPSQDEPTRALTTSGKASGPLLGGNLNMIATSAGWALPDLNGAILLLEAVELHLGQVDRELTMLRKAGHLDGIAAVAVGQFTKFARSGSLTIVDLLRDHLDRLGVPVLGGIPVGHGPRPVSVTLGLSATLDADAGTLTVEPLQPA